MSSGIPAPSNETKVISYKIIAACSRCGYKDSLYNKHEYIEDEKRSLMWRCQKCDKDQVFHYTVRKKQQGV